MSGRGRGSGIGLHRLLRQREEGTLTNRGSQMRGCRRLYEYLVPDTTIPGVEKCPNCHLRRFTDDGNLLLAFSRCGHQFIGFRFKGHTWGERHTDDDTPSPPAGDGLNNGDASERRRNGNGASSSSSSQSFEDFFTLGFKTSVCTEPDSLCKDFCVILAGGKYVLLASCCMGDNFNDERNANSPAVPNLPQFSRVTFHIVRLEDGVVTDTFTLLRSFVNLLHNGGVHVCDDLLLILNIRYQKMYILQIRPEGKFVFVQTIGPHCYGDDELVLRTHFEEEARYRFAMRDTWRRKGVEDPQRREDLLTQDDNFFKSEMLSGFKQKILSFILRESMSRDSGRKQSEAVRYFFYNFNIFSKLHVSRAQFLDKQHLLLKMTGVEGLISRSSDASQHNAYFALYNFTEAKVEGFFSNADGKLLSVIEENSGALVLPPAATPWVRMAAIVGDGARKHRHTSTTLSSRQAIRRAISSIPHAPMNYCCSPYLDPTLFQYDERMISTADRPRTCVEHPIKFLLRSRQGLLGFKISPPQMMLGSSEGRGKKLVSFIFHPTLPFVISILLGFQRPQVVSFHLRK